ncbi:SGNH/GDSL hydrolase family protein [Nakamurella antarctica]|uniref:SGNH/GDSL hydrolase family protein n=1 Tax=Nakamurella antarctica TaxID=1902245 RepID=A0A3G8ZJP9_9ACTN|nr:SGNH/GDSL hydrolase family protein [Nakamurella antarctica]AZI57493.1 SGNH/GDSL hydrolase family protein [Nakamurella antarctica]
MTISRYVALGDSFTEGVGDPRPDGTMRGWADLVAGELAKVDAVQDSKFHYANLSIRGKLLGQIVDDQMELALQMAPDLITFAAGGNDILRLGSDIASLLRLCDQVVARMVDHGIRVVLFTGANPSGHLPLGRVIRSYGDRFCSGVRDIALKRGTDLVDMWDEAQLQDSRYWDLDRLHLNAAGHQQVAARVLRTLDIPYPVEWTEEAPALALPEHPLLAQAEYYRGHVLPWVQRRLSGKSSGDEMGAKRPELAPVASEVHHEAC